MPEARCLLHRTGEREDLTNVPNSFAFLREWCRFAQTQYYIRVLVQRVSSMSVERKLREIVYVDLDLAQEMLEVIDGGRLVKVSEGRSRSSERKGTGSLGLAALGAALRASVGSGASDSRSQETSGSPLGQYGRLLQALEERGLVTEVFGSDTQAWAGIQEGEFVACSVIASIAPFQSFLLQVDEFITAVGQLSAFMPIEQVSQFELSERQMKQLQAVFVAQRGIPVLMQPADSASVGRRFWGFLKTAGAEGGTTLRRQQIEGERTVVGRVRRVLRKGQSVDLLQVGPLSLPREQVREMMRSLQKMPFGREVRLSDLKISAPAVELQVISLVV